MISSESRAVGVLLKQYRVRAGLTQEELALRARLSGRAISDLERGVRRAPHKDTLALLAEALSLSEGDRALLLETARRSRAMGTKLGGTSERDTPQCTDLATSLTPLTPLIGREREEAAIVHLLSRDDVRLVTLTGPAGIGKTRLAQQVAASLGQRFADGVVFVALATVAQPAFVLRALAQALGLREQTTQPTDEQLRTYLAERELLLVLDNFEHVARVGPAIAAILAACSRVKALVTSRTALQVRGEQEFSVPPLEIPDLERLLPLDDLVRYPAVALFVHRAQAVKPAFSLTPALAPVIAAICVRLDGLPLALELAAARIKVLSLQALLARLDPCLPILTHGGRDLPERQQTMRGAIAWSYDLLDEREQRLFRRLAVFVDGWTVEASEAICDDHSTERATVLDALTALVNQSLVVQEAGADGEYRFRLLEVVREYGLEHLALYDEASALRQRHAEYYLALIEMAELELHGSNQALWLERLSHEHGNFRAALQWAEESGEVELGLRLGVALWWFWQQRNHLHEGQTWLERFLARQQTGVGPPDYALRADALKGAGNLAWYQGDYDTAKRLLEASLALYRELGNTFGAAHVLNTLGLIEDGRGEYERALTLYEECLTLRRAIDDTSGVACVLNNIGLLVCREGRYAKAITLYNESIALHRAVGDRWGVVVALGNRATATLRQGDLERAAMLLEECLTLFTELGDKVGIAETLAAQGELARERGELESAALLSHDALALSREVGSKSHIVDSLDGAAEVALAQRRATPATRLFALASELRERYQMPRSPLEAQRLAPQITSLCSVLGDAAFSAQWASGQVMTLEQALDEIVVQRPTP